MKRGAGWEGQVGNALPGHALDPKGVHLILVTSPAQNQALHLLLRSGIFPATASAHTWWVVR